jgi:hypothetical protein
MHFLCRSFIGKNNSNNWSQYWENEPDDDLKLAKGHLFGLINLVNKQDEGPVTIGHDIISEINQLYFSQDTNDISVNLKNTLNTLSQNPIFLNYQIDLALVVVSDNQVFLSTFGTNNCILQRNDQISFLIKGKDHQIVSSCGSLIDNDRILLTSTKFFETITWDKIKTILVDSKIQNIEENFISLLYSASDQNQVSAVLIECHQDNQNIITEPVDKTDEIIINDNTQEPQNNTEVITPTSSIYQKKPDSIFVHHQSNFKVSRRKKTQLILAIILIIGLSISIYYGNQKNKNIKAESNFISLKTELELKLNNINTVKGLDINAAVEIAKEAKKIVDQMSSLSVHQQEVSQYKSQIDTLLFQTGSDENVNPQMVQDTSFIVSQPQFSRLYFFNNNLYLLDPLKGRLDVLNPQNKSNQNLIISDSIKSATHLLFNNESPYLVKDNKLSLVEKNNLIPKFDFSLSDSTLTITDIDFWNGSLYVLDNQNQSIWKLSPNSSGFSTPQKWLKNDNKLEIGANSLAIDGQVWVLNHSGQIDLYTSGIKDKFSQKKTINFTKAVSLVTDSESDFLVFNDNSEFIYVYRKNGEYYSKYNLSKYKIIDLAFDSTNKTIYFLSLDQKIYQISL